MEDEPFLKKKNDREHKRHICSIVKGLDFGTDPPRKKLLWSPPGVTYKSPHHPNDSSMNKSARKGIASRLPLSVSYLH